MIHSNHAQHQTLPASRILVMRYRFIGDTILTVPFLRNLRNAYKDAQIDVLVGPQSGSVLEGCPYIDDLIVFDTTRFHKYDRGQQRPGNFLSYALGLRKRSYDLIFVLKRSFSSALLSWLAGAKYRVGYDTQGRGWLLTHRSPWRKSIHEVESTLDVLQAANVPVSDDYLEAWISSKEKQEIFEFVPELSYAGPKILIHAASAHPDKVYPLEKWSEIIRELHSQFNILPFYTGAAQDRALYDELDRLCSIQGVNLAGKLTLRQSMALYQQLDLAVCVDSGPSHLASAAGTPTVALFGPTDPVRWRPWGDQHAAIFDRSLPCRPCNYYKTCDDRPCLTKLEPQIVASRCVNLLTQGKAVDRSVCR